MTYQIIKNDGRDFKRVEITIEGDQIVCGPEQEHQTPPLPVIREDGLLLHEPSTGLLCSFGGTEIIKAKTLPLRSCDVIQKGDSEWTPLPARKAARFGEATTMIHTESGNIKLFAIGGATESSASVITEMLELNTTNHIDIQCGWRRIQPLPSGRHNSSVLVVGQKLYVIGGRSGPKNAGRVLRDIICLDLAAIDQDITSTANSDKTSSAGMFQWDQVGELSEGRFNCSVIALSDRYIAIIGGYTGVKVLTSVEIFDTQEEVCFPAPFLINERKDSTPLIVNHPIHGSGIMIIGGSNPIKNKTNVSQSEIWYPQNRGTGWAEIEDFALPEPDSQYDRPWHDRNCIVVSDNPSSVGFDASDLMTYSLSHKCHFTNSSRWREVEREIKSGKKDYTFQLSPRDHRSIDLKESVASAVQRIDTKQRENVKSGGGLFMKPTGWKRPNPTPKSCPVSRIIPPPKTPDINTQQDAISETTVTRQTDSSLLTVSSSSVESSEKPVAPPEIYSISTPDCEESGDSQTELTHASLFKIDESCESVVQADLSERPLHTCSIDDLCHRLESCSKTIKTEAQRLGSEIRKLRSNKVDITDIKRDRIWSLLERQDLSLAPLPSFDNTVLVKLPADHQKNRSTKFTPPEFCEQFELSPKMNRQDYFESSHNHVHFNDGHYYDTVSIMGSWDDWDSEVRCDTVDGYNWYCPLHKNIKGMNIEFKMKTDSGWRLNPLFPRKESNDGNINNVITITDQFEDMETTDSLPMESVQTIGINSTKFDPRMTLDEILNKGWLLRSFDTYEHIAELDPLTFFEK